MTSLVNPTGADALRGWASEEQLAEVLATSPRVVTAWLSGAEVRRRALPPRRVRRVREFSVEHTVEELLEDVDGTPRYRRIMHGDHR